MKGVVFMLGRTLQLLGFIYVAAAFFSFFSAPDMAKMMKDTVIGLLEFYAGYFLVMKTGEKVEEPKK
ncbi:hypothetical protein HZA43_02915 [Candidatus Peregrinibacteria bacterium]|nr:hypothetical protein [Candidatus Peregrinibacteria bacterium]